MVRDNKTKIQNNKTMKLIPLTKGLFAKVDDEDYEYLMQFKWHSSKAKSGIYAKTSICVNGKSCFVTMHKMINKTKEGYLTDHIDHDTLNNQKLNLRSCTIEESNFNRRRIKKGNSSYKGVTFEKNESRWRARIQHKEKVYCIGSFKTEVDAAKAYDAKAKELYKEFAHLNFK